MFMTFCLLGLFSDFTLWKTDRPKIDNFSPKSCQSNRAVKKSRLKKTWPPSSPENGSQLGWYVSFGLWPSFRDLFLTFYIRKMLFSSNSLIPPKSQFSRFFLKRTSSLRSNSVTRHVNCNKTKIGGKYPN